MPTRKRNAITRSLSGSRGTLRRNSRRPYASLPAPLRLLLSVQVADESRLSRLRVFTGIGSSAFSGPPARLRAPPHAVRRARRDRRTRNAEAHPADLRSAGPDRTPRSRPSARDVGNAMGDNGGSAPLRPADMARADTCPLIAAGVDSLRCMSSRLKPLPPKKPPRFDQFLRERSEWLWAVAGLPRQLHSGVIPSRPPPASSCQRPSTTANARRASSYAPSSLGCSGGTRRKEAGALLGEEAPTARGRDSGRGAPASSPRIAQSSLATPALEAQGRELSGLPESGRAGRGDETFLGLGA